MTRLAIVQKAPVFLDKHKTLERAVGLVDEAAAAGAGLVIFSEAFIPGYPAWIWRLRPGGDWGISEQVHARLLQSAVSLEGDDLAPLFEAARRHELTIVCGLNERDSGLSRATLYNTVVVIGPDGSLLNRHRKLMPTNPERMVWGFGDASGLRAVDTPAGRIGALICWENYMPLARYALYSQGGGLYRADLRQRRRLDRHLTAYRPRRPLLGGGQRQPDQGRRHPGGFSRQGAAVSGSG